MEFHTIMFGGVSYLFEVGGVWVGLKIAAITRSFHILGFEWKAFEAVSGT